MYLQLAEDTSLSKKVKKDKRNPAAAIALAPGRALFLGMLDMNIDGLATKLSRQNFAELRSAWLKAGGDPDKLAKNINTGKGKKPKKIGFVSKFKTGGSLSEVSNPFLNAYGPSYYLSEDLTDSKKAAIISAATAAGTALGSVVPALGNVAGAAAGASLGGVVVAIYPIFKKSANDPVAEDETKTPDPTPSVPENTGTTDEEETAGMDKKKILIYGGAAVVGLGLIYYLTKGKK